MREPGPRLLFARLTLLNLLRRPGRTAAVLMAVILAAGTAFAGGLISLGVGHAVEVGMARLGADLMVVPEGAVEATHNALVMGEPVAFYMDGSVAGQVAAVEGVAGVSPQIYVETLAHSACCTGRLFLVGFDPESDFTVRPWLMRTLGRDLSPDEIIVGNHVLMLEGESMRFYGTDFRVAGRLDTTGMGMDETVFLPQEAVAIMAARSVTEAEQPLEIEPGQISALMVKVENPARAEEVARRIEAAVAGVSAITSGQVTQGVTGDLSALLSWLLPVTGGVMLVAVLLFVILFSAITAERAREIGLLRAMGATARQAIASLVGEALLMGTLGGLAGVGAGLLVYGLFKNAIRVTWTLPFLWPSALQQAGLAALVVAAAGALGALAAAWPAWRIARQEPHYAIHSR